MKKYKIHTKGFRVYVHLNVYHAVCSGTGAEYKMYHTCTLIHKTVYHVLKNVYHTPILSKIPIYLHIPFK